MAERPSVTCPLCGRTSYHPEDVRQGYCGFCHDWTSPPYGTRWPAGTGLDTRRCGRCGVDVPLLAWRTGDHVVAVMSPLRYETGDVDQATDTVPMVVRGEARFAWCSQLDPEATRA